MFNALSPNGDGMNETFEYSFILPDGTKAALVSELLIFNRWGNVVYQNDEYYLNENERFIGRESGAGEELLDGTYFLYHIIRSARSKRKL